MIRFIARIVVLCLVLLPAHAWAGSSEGGRSVLPPAEVAAFADSVQQDLAARGARVAIVARMGRDPSSLPEGIRYTHVAYWVFSEVVGDDGRTGTGYRVYNLYQEADRPHRSRLIQDSPAEFFAGATRLDAGIVIPDARLQQRLLDVIGSPAYGRLHNPSYAVLANPSDPRFQNCTEHTLDVLMAGLYRTADRDRIKANIGAHFDAQVVRLGGAKRALGPLASKAFTTADHGPVVATATFGSIARFMEGHDLTQEVYRVTPWGAARF